LKTEHKQQSAKDLLSLSMHLQTDRETEKTDSQADRHPARQTWVTSWTAGTRPQSGRPTSSQTDVGSELVHAGSHAPPLVADRGMRLQGNSTE